MKFDMVKNHFSKSFDKTIVVEDFTGQIDTPKTKKIAEVLNKIVNITDTSQRTLIILSDINNNVKLSLRNLSNITVLHSNTLNVKDILLAHKILVTDKALKNIQEVYSEN